MGKAKTQSPAVLAAYDSLTFTSSNDHLLPYRLLSPKNQKPAERYPLVLFLHGAGERGADNQLQLTHGAQLFLDQQADFPAFVVFPQCQTDDYWAQMIRNADGQREFNFAETPNPSLGAVQELLPHLITTLPIDTNRIYLMGLSMGGMGTFELLARAPNTFAAAVAICGGTNPDLLPIYAKDVPLWIFHGDADKVVDVALSRRVVSRLRAMNINCRYTEYEGVGHNSWDAAFKEKELLSWIFTKRQ